MHYENFAKNFADFENRYPNELLQEMTHKSLRMTDKKSCLYDQLYYVLALVAISSDGACNLLPLTGFDSKFLLQV